MSPIVYFGHVIIIALVVPIGHVVRTADNSAIMPVGVAPSQYWYVRGIISLEDNHCTVGANLNRLGMAMMALGRLLPSRSVLHHKTSEFYPHHRARLSGLFSQMAASRAILITAHIYRGSTSTSRRHGTTRVSSSSLSMRKACSAIAITQTLDLIP